MDLTPTLSSIELLWIVAGLICLPATLRSWRRAVANRRVLRAADPRRVPPARRPGFARSADIDVRWRAVAAVIQAVLLGVGLRAAWAPPPETPPTWDGALVGVAMVAMQALLLWVAVRNDAEEAALLAEYQAAARRAAPRRPPASNEQ